MCTDFNESLTLCVSGLSDPIAIPRKSTACRWAAKRPLRKRLLSHADFRVTTRILSSKVVDDVVQASHSDLTWPMDQLPFGAPSLNEPQADAAQRSLWPRETTVASPHPHLSFSSFAASAESPRTMQRSRSTAQAPSSLSRARRALPRPRPSRSLRNWPTVARCRRGCCPREQGS